MKKIPFHRSLLNSQEKKQILKDCERLCEIGIYTEGVFNDSLETLIQEISGFQYAVTFSSGTAALYCALQAFDTIEGKRDEVITTPVTWIASQNAIEVAGGEAYFYDVDENGIINLSDLSERRLYDDRIAAIMPVSLYGQKVDTKKMEVGVPVVLDAAHSINQLNQMKEMECNIICFSLHPTKLFFGGEGGFAITNDKDYYEQMKMLRWQGMRRGNRFRWKESLKFILPEFSAICAYRTLANFENRVDDLRATVRIYRGYFDDYDWNLMPLGDDDVTMITIRVNAECRHDLISHLESQGIGAKVKYLSLWPSIWAPVTRRFCQEIVTLPCYYHMVPETIERIVKTIFIYHLDNNLEVER